MEAQTKICQNCKKDFVIDQEDFNFYEKIKVPAPTFCPECRMIRRYSFRNERMLFRRKDSHDEKEIFSGFSPEANVVTYENSYWFGAEWDSLDTGAEFDFSKLFFEQFRNLLSIAPIPARSVYNLVNSDYCNEASEMKNSYLCFNCDYIENSGYLRKMNRVKDSFDLYEGTEDELCYENVIVDKSYRTFFSTDCESCVDVYFSKGLRGCINCFGCVNLTKKSNYFFNESCTKEEYDAKVAEYNLASHKEIEELKKKAYDFWLKFPVKYNHTLRTINSTGERIFDSKNVKNSYSVRGSENLRYCQDIQYKGSNSYDYSVWGDGAENIYECMTCGMGAYNVKFSFNCWEEARDLEYCGFCLGSSNCFGCVGLYKKSYCILNKQYSKEEYFAMREKIISQMNEMPYVDKVGRIYKYGEFFPFDLSPYAYNESIAQDFFPLNEEEAEKKGLVWREVKLKEYKATILVKDLPDDVSEATEDILKEIIECSDCLKVYRIVFSEFQFYKRVNLPIPRKCHNCRFLDRFKFVNPPKLWNRSCMKEGCCNEFQTSYSPDRPEIIYCESCYQREVN